MRHGKKFNHLGRTKPHREAMLANMASSLVKHKKINTTVAKAKALRSFIEPLITKAKNDTTHSRRVVFRYLQDKYAVTELFRDVAPKIATRPGGYTRILKTGNRSGDNADMCFIELVDFNEIRSTETETATDKKKRTRRTRKSAQGKKTDMSSEALAKEDVSTAALPTGQAGSAKVEAEEQVEAPAKKEAEAKVDVVEDAVVIEETVTAEEEVKEDVSSDVSSEAPIVIGAKVEDTTEDSNEEADSSSEASEEEESEAKDDKKT